MTEPAPELHEPLKKSIAAMVSIIKPTGKAYRQNGDLKGKSEAEQDCIEWSDKIDALDKALAKIGLMATCEITMIVDKNDPDFTSWQYKVKIVPLDEEAKP